MHGRLTAIIRYWFRYECNDKKVVLSFGLGASVTVNSIDGIPTIKEWKCTMDFESNKLVARGINTEFPMHYEASKYGIPTGVSLSSADFVWLFYGNVLNA